MTWPRWLCFCLAVGLAVSAAADSSDESLGSAGPGDAPALTIHSPQDGDMFSVELHAWDSLKLNVNVTISNFFSIDGSFALFVGGGEYLLAQQWQPLNGNSIITLDIPFLEEDALHRLEVLTNGNLYPVRLEFALLDAGSPPIRPFGRRLFDPITPRFSEQEGEREGAFQDGGLRLKEGAANQSAQRVGRRTLAVSPFPPRRPLTAVSRIGDRRIRTRDSVRDASVAHVIAHPLRCAPGAPPTPLPHAAALAAPTRLPPPVQERCHPPSSLPHPPLCWSKYLSRPHRLLL